jgi:hypothetical protein
MLRVFTKSGNVLCVRSDGATRNVSVNLVTPSCQGKSFECFIELILALPKD